MAKRETTNLIDFDAIRITLASPEQIEKWSYGEVTKPETINYRTQRPEKDGLFDERIFGPTKDYECYCGKYKKIRYKGVICDKCGVEVTRSAVRRERMGHIKLAVPIAHIWYLRGVPSRIGLFLDLSVQELEKVIYFGAFIIMEVNEELRKKALEALDKEFREYKKTRQKSVKMEVVDQKVPQSGSQVTSKSSQKIFNSQPTARELESLEIAYRAARNELENLRERQIISEMRVFDLSMKYGQIIKVGIGAEAIRELLKKIDLDAEIDRLRAEIKRLPSGQQNRRLARRLKLFHDFKVNSMRPEWMILTSLPVIPPDLRPMVQLDGGRFAASDLNDLYRRVINRNNRLKRLISQGAPEVICRNEKRMLQEAVDALIDNSARREKAVTAANRRKLKSLSDMLRGKQGRFRQNLLGKRVDYSGRSVIVVGPELKLHQCGIPKVMALELFKPFVISRLIKNGFAHNVKNATRLIEKQTPEVWDILEDIAKEHTVLLNRAPTLHRLGIQSFQPVLIEGKAIQIHPLVCHAYNADFDGDQMAVYVPLSKQAQYEADNIMLSVNNLLKPAAGEPVVSPFSDMILGCFYLTSFDKNAQYAGKIFSSPEEAIIAFENKVISLRMPIEVCLEENQKPIKTSVGRIIFNQALPPKLGFKNETMDKKALRKVVAEIFAKYGNQETARAVDNIKKLGFDYVCRSGMTFAAADILVPDKKKELLSEAEKHVLEIDRQYAAGLITGQERHLKIAGLWMKIKGEVEEAMLRGFTTENPIYATVRSGARGNLAQLTQIAGMKGLVANPAGEIIDLPVKANYKEGFDEFEYFISTHGARKGRSDTALRTADAGYLTRRLIDVAQDVIVTSADCGVEKGFKYSRQESEESGESFADRIKGRILSADIKDPKSKKILYKKGELITSEAVKRIIAYEVPEVEVFTVLGCKNLWGVCQKCYGQDLGTGRKVEIGTAVGIIAAQAIGEPGTQLTMRTFHIGGIVGEDITQGLPRVEELFEVRPPKFPAVLSEIAGQVKITSSRDKKIITVYSDKKRVEEYKLSGNLKPQVKTGQQVKAKQALASGPRQKTLRAPFEGICEVNKNKIILKSKENVYREYQVPPKTLLKVKDGQNVTKGQALTEGQLNLSTLLSLAGPEVVQRYIIREVQDIYASQGQTINDKHIELIIRQMFSRVRIKDPGDSDYLMGQIIDKLSLDEENQKILRKKGRPAKAEPLLLGITKVALSTESFLSAASFQETTGILIEAATSGKIDKLRGLKENVIIGKLIPAGTGFLGSESHTKMLEAISAKKIKKSELTE